MPSDLEGIFLILNLNYTEELSYYNFTEHSKEK